MTGALIARRLAEAGFPEDGLPAKERLADAVLQGLFRLSGGPPDGAWWVPGRLEIFGKHTDYAGGHTLVAALPRGFIVVARRRDDGAIRLRDALRHEDLTLEPGDPSHSKPALTGWRNYAAVVVRRLTRNFPGPFPGADIVMASDLPSASGMSSSSALVIGLAGALAALAGLRDRPEWRENVADAQAEAGYYACIENGLTFGTLRGDLGVGTHGGSEDHVAILCSHPGAVSAWRFVPIRPEGDIPLPDGWTFVVASSGVAARKTGAAMGAYNRLSREAAILVEAWSKAEGPVASLRTVLQSGPSAPERLLAWIRESGLDASAVQALERRLEHFLREDARVLEAAAAFRAADRGRLGALADASQRDAETLLGNQVPETIALARAAREVGACAASSFGAGFGGSAWALVEPGTAPDFSARWLAVYRAAFPARAGTATAFIAPLAPGVTELI